VIVAAIDEAQQGGARLRAACHLVGVSVRTIQRWQGHPNGDDRRVDRDADREMP
jgi:transposase